MARLRRLGVCLWLALTACSLDRGATLPSATKQDAAATSGTGGSTDLPTAGTGSAAAGTLGTGTSGMGGSLDAAPQDLDASGLGIEGGFALDAGSDAGPMGYTPGGIGAPCTSDRDCMSATTSSTCFTEGSFAGLLSLPGGACASLCDISMGLNCEPGSTCITIPTFPPVLICMRQCVTDADCRAAEGYKCKKPFGHDQSVCSLPE